MSKKILLADDSITIQKVVSLTLASEDYELLIVGDGDSALEKAREIRPELIIADISMPGMNGYELCEAIKRDEELAAIPVMLLASTFEAIDEEKAERVGADGHMVKPFESEELIAHIKDLLSRPPKAVAEGPVEEPQPEEVTLREEPVPSFGEEPVVAAKGPEEPVSIREEEGKEELTLSEDIWEPEDFIEARGEEKPQPQEAASEEAGGEEEFFDLSLAEDEAETTPERPEEPLPSEEEPSGAEPVKEEEEEPVIDEITELTTPVIEEAPGTEEAQPFTEPVREPTFEAFAAEEVPAQEAAPRPSEVKEEELTEEKLSALLPPEKVEKIVRDVARKVIEEVAWDVVPELAEEYIKKEIINKLKDAISKLK